MHLVESPGLHSTVHLFAVRSHAVSGGVFAPRVIVWRTLLVLQPRSGARGGDGKNGRCLNLEPLQLLTAGGMAGKKAHKQTLGAELSATQRFLGESKSWEDVKRSCVIRHRAAEGD